MAWSIVQGPAAKASTTSSTNIVTTPAPGVSTTAGNSLIVIVWPIVSASMSPAITDSAGNTYHHDVDASAVGSGAGCHVFSCHNAASVAASTGWFKATLGSGFSDWGLLVIEAATGGAAGAFDLASPLLAAQLRARPSSGPSGVVAGGAELVLGIGVFETISQAVATSPAWTPVASDQIASADAGIYVSCQTPTPASGTYTFQGNIDAGATSVLSTNAYCVVYKITGAVTGAGVISGALASRGGKSEYLANALVAHALGKTSFTMPSALYLTLCTAVPTANSTGSTISEAAYTGYARIQVHATDLSAASGGVMANVNSLAFPASTGGSATIVGWALCDAATNGNMLYFAPLPAAAPSFGIAVGSTPTIPIGQLVVGEL